ncbi:MAG: FtsX-like permease family protein [Candidatus Aminicenantales bacterium]
MMKFLLKGILRDRTRSLFPFLIVTVGVFLSVALYGYLRGAEIDVVRSNANLGFGHVRVLTAAYARDIEQLPNDLALTGVSALTVQLCSAFPGMIWTPRIEYGGLLDVPDEKGETRAQAPIAGLAVELRAPSGPERELLGLDRILVRGRLPEKPGDMLISEGLAEKLKVNPGDKATLIGTTMHGSMALENFVISGTIRFGIQAMDRMAAIADLADVQKALDMPDAAGEILGFFQDGFYNQEKAAGLAQVFQARFGEGMDEFRPVIQTLRDQPGMDYLFRQLAYVTFLIVGIFLLSMSLVLWNAGLLGTLRRYGEFGVRLAIGEDKSRVYRSMIVEALMIGVLGSIAGTVLGLGLSYYLQAKGIDLSGMLKNVSFLMPTVIRSKVTPFSYVIGFIPGLVATLVGSAIAGRAIYKRQTASLFKELES